MNCKIDLKTFEKYGHKIIENFNRFSIISDALKAVPDIGDTVDLPVELLSDLTEFDEDMLYDFIQFLHNNEKEEMFNVGCDGVFYTLETLEDFWNFEKGNFEYLKILKEGEGEK